MAWKQTIEKIRKDVKTEHGKQWRRTDADKLKVLISYRHWRQAGYEVALICKRLKVAKDSVRRWALELGFELEPEGRKQAGRAVPRTEGGLA